MKEKNSRILNPAPLLLSFLFATASATVFRALRFIWVFFDPFLKFTGGANGLFIIFLVNIAVSLCLFILSAYKRDLTEGRKIFSVIAVISCVITLTATAASILIPVFGGRETRVTVSMYLKRDLILPSVFTLGALLVAAFPLLENKKKKLCYIFFAVILAGGFVSFVFPSSPYAVTTDPCVFDTGKDYSVVFATNKAGTGYVEYSHNGKDYKVYDTKNGRRISDRFIHSVNIPYEHLDNNSYTVGSTQVRDDFSYGSRLGKTVEKGPFDFSCPKDKTQKYLVVSDWHTYMKDAYAAISNIGDYDAVLFMGDPAAGMDFEEEAVRYIVNFGGKLTSGTMPIIYVRGNHETRGPFASYLADYLGYDSFYYLVSRGDYTFIVLDSGEDKPDSHIEYGSLDDYALNRVEMADQLEKAHPSGSYLIALSHAWQVSEPEKELSERIWNCLDNFGVRFVISGHTHENRFLDGQTDWEKEYLEKYPGIVTYIDGGHSGKTYIASSVTLSPEGAYFESYDNSGNKIIDKKIGWNG